MENKFPFIIYHFWPGARKLFIPNSFPFWESGQKGQKDILKEVKTNQDLLKGFMTGTAEGHYESFIVRLKSWALDYNKKSLEDAHVELVKFRKLADKMIGVIYL